MENFFDLASPQELIDILGEDDPDLPDAVRGYAFNKEMALKEPDYHYSLLSTLYAGRDDMRKAEKYAALIKDDDAYL
ncbi:MAG: hypothetical protein LBC55_01275, partial [Desulfovibrio sp.]|nr:hypothetical protein [Desulfovibrio sp.]